MIPDKIYIPPGLDCPWMEKGYFGDIEYLRKDALLEYLDKELDRLCELLPDASNLGQYMQTKKLFDKLNSL